MARYGFGLNDLLGPAAGCGQNDRLLPLSPENFVCHEQVLGRKNQPRLEGAQDYCCDQDRDQPDSASGRVNTAAELVNPNGVEQHGWNCDQCEQDRGFQAVLVPLKRDEHTHDSEPHNVQHISADQAGTCLDELTGEVFSHAGPNT